MNFAHDRHSILRIENIDEATPVAISGANPCVIKVLRRDPGAVMSVLFPHKRTTINDEAVHLNLRALNENTIHPIEVMIVEDPPGGRIDPYVAWNVALDYVTTPYMVFHNSDIVVSHKWDVEFVNHLDPMSILYNYLVEPGVLGCHEKNVHADFGKCPRCFNRAGFESFCREKRILTQPNTPEKGFAIQVVFPVELMNKVGRFPTAAPFMVVPNDLIMIEKMEALGARHLRVNSWAYHFQNFTARRNACGCYEQKSTRPGEQP